MSSGRSYQVVEGPYFRDLQAQPDALAAVIKAFPDFPSLCEVARELAAGRFARVVLTGMGSSLHALYPLHLALSRRDITSVWVETAELLLGYDGLYRADTLLLVVSQSGESAEIVKLVGRAEKFGQVLGVTNNPESTLGRRAAAVLPMCSGGESTVSCKSYLNTLAVLLWVGEALLGGDLTSVKTALRMAEAGARDYLARWLSHVDELITLTDGVRSVFLAGRGESLATTGTGGLILKESTHRPAEGMSCAAFRHGPFEMVGPDVLVLIFRGEERVAALNRRLLEDIQQAGGRAAWVAPDGQGAFAIPTVPPTVRPILEMLPVQMLSLALAARAGREAGRFERGSKITTVE